MRLTCIKTNLHIRIKWCNRKTTATTEDIRYRRRVFEVIQKVHDVYHRTLSITSLRISPESRSNSGLFFVYYILNHMWLISHDAFTGMSHSEIRLKVPILSVFSDTSLVFIEKLKKPIRFHSFYIRMFANLRIKHLRIKLRSWMR